MEAQEGGGGVEGGPEGERGTGLAARKERKKEGFCIINYIYF